jgi:hypothetical protein
VIVSERPMTENSYLDRALKVFIHIGLVALLAAACLLVLSPFIAVVTWGRPSPWPVTRRTAG